MSENIILKKTGPPDIPMQWHSPQLFYLKCFLCIHYTLTSLDGHKRHIYATNDVLYH